MKSLMTSALAVALVSLSAPAAEAQQGPPAPGTCFSYSADQWVGTAYMATAVDCAVPHNGEVLAQVMIPEEIAATGYGSSAMKGWAFQACQPLAVDYIWSPSATQKPKYPKASFVLPRTARLNVQLPIVEAWSAGESWAACLGQSRNTALSAAQNRTGSVRSLGLKPYICLNPSSWKGVKCQKSGAVRLTNQVWLPTEYGASYPGTKVVLPKTAKACNSLRLKNWSLRTWYVPGLSAWDRGNKFGFCEFLAKG